MSACEKGRLWSQALRLLVRMWTSEITPEVVTVTAALGAVASSAKWEKAPAVASLCGGTFSQRLGTSWTMALALLDMGELQPSIAAFRSALAAAELAGEPVAARFAEVGLWRRTARGEGRSAPKHRGEYAGATSQLQASGTPLAGRLLCGSASQVLAALQGGGTSAARDFYDVGSLNARLATERGGQGPNAGQEVAPWAHSARRALASALPSPAPAAAAAAQLAAWCEADLALPARRGSWLQQALAFLQDLQQMVSAKKRCGMI
ncbi:unnamed protein product [Symbiodinium necroappetens]|uniref:Pentatricopeptide repeat-containing protein, chloroplastic n=1 Tax=Symbiodinium necroappetens TaxID=1628268 RepID=A0A812N386_9DINO|nr:unnamed protein product [Symbiodinium necroappetens]